MMLERIGKYIDFFGKDKRGDTNTIGWIVLVIFIILVAAPMIERIGQTVSSGAESLNSRLTKTLEE